MNWRKKDNLLIEGCLQEKKEAFRALYNKYKTSQFVLCQRYANSKSEAEDYLQEGFIVLFRDLHQYNSKKGAFKPWMNRVFINVCLQQIRKKRAIPYHEEIGNHEEVIACEPDVNELINRKELVELLMQLPTGYKTVFNMYVIDGYSHNEIAQKLQISTNTSKTQLYKARKQLAKWIVDQKQINKNHG